MPIGGLLPRRKVRLGSLRRTTPLSEHWGADRGTPIDRYYIEQFLSTHSADIGGRALEVKDSRYTQQFGTAVSRADVIDIDPENRAATVVADLGVPEGLPAGTFDCFIVTQTLQFIFPVEAAVRGARRLLTPGGVLLATVPAVSRVDRHAGADGDFWRFTAASCARLFGGAFSEEHVEVTAYGNVLAAIGFLAGLAREELTEAELDAHDPYFPVLIGVRAVRT
jgi:SAM-dependent methyltransferase